jgi:hypothetical protein
LQLDDGAYVALATVVVGSFDGAKAIVEIIGSDRAGDLAAGGAPLERMLFAALDLDRDETGAR